MAGADRAGPNEGPNGNHAPEPPSSKSARHQPLSIGWCAYGEQIAYTIDHAGASTLLVNDEFVELVRSILPRLSRVKQLVVLSDRQAPTIGQLGFAGEYEELLAAASPDYEFPDFDEDTQATTFYTTGTTGLPKGVSAARSVSLSGLYRLPLPAGRKKSGR